MERFSNDSGSLGEKVKTAVFCPIFKKLKTKVKEGFS